MPAARSLRQELEDVFRKARHFVLVATFDLPGGVTIWAELSNLRTGRGGSARRVNLAWRETTGDVTNWLKSHVCNSIDDALRHLAATYPSAVPRPDSVTVRIPTAPATAAKLRPVAVQALNEALGLPVLSRDELTRQQKAAKAEVDGTVALLRTGRAGVEEFNKWPNLKRVTVDLGKADLSGCDLEGVSFACVKRTNKANFSGARLAGADLGAGGFGDARFSGADLTGASLNYGKFPRADFTGANLNGADLADSDLKGANFSGATLTDCNFERAKFDEHTRWPKGFKPPAGMAWKGVGPDPRLAPTKQEKKLPKPTDFAGFLDRLKKATDAAKLDKAMAMLKADRFRLFARVQPDHLVGVVKSQSDPSLVYSCRLGADGSYACCTQNLNVCGGLRGSPCKHLLVLIVGLTQAGELDPGTAHDWAQASRGKKPALDKDAMTETLLQYKGAEAGEVDWRPTETIPEDFYAL
jgi:hypothetical protein